MPAAVLHIRHVPGVDNVVANTLSRPPSHRAGPDSCSHTAGAVSAVFPSAEMLDYASIAKNQLVCPLTQKAASSSSLRLVHVNVHGHQLLIKIRTEKCPRRINHRHSLIGYLFTSRHTCVMQYSTMLICHLIRREWIKLAIILLGLYCSKAKLVFLCFPLFRYKYS